MLCINTDSYSVELKSLWIGKNICSSGVEAKNKGLLCWHGTFHHYFSKSSKQEKETTILQLITSQYGMLDR